MANSKAKMTDAGSWVGEDHDGAHIDSSTIRVIPDAYEELRYSKDELSRVTRRCSGDTINHVPGFRYWEMGRDRTMDHPNNNCGHQQRAFDFYWSILCGMQRGEITLGIGTGSTTSPSQFGIDFYCGTYVADGRPQNMTDNGYPHLKWNADDPLPFPDAKFGAVISNHSIEHLHNQEQALREWLRVVEIDGFVCIITPDMTFNQRGSVDATHTREFCVDEFWEWLKGINDLPSYEVFALNTLDNMFSFDVVLKRKG